MEILYPLAILALAVSMFRKDSRIDTLQRKLDLVLKRLEVEWPEQATQEQLRALLASGKKIDAIKAYRSATGAGLADAKAAIEAMAETPIRALPQSDN